MNKGLVFVKEEDSASNGGHRKQNVCIDGVHLLIKDNWYDQTGDEFNAFKSHETSIIGPCDGSCRVELNDKQMNLVKEFLEEGKKGDFGFSIRLYPDEPPPEDEPSYQT